MEWSGVEWSGVEWSGGRHDRVPNIVQVGRETNSWTFGWNDIVRYTDQL